MITLFLLGLTTYAQEWQYFPLDELRVYEIPEDEERQLTGIDFRTHFKQGENTIIKFDSFSFYRELHKLSEQDMFYDWRYLTGNSILGAYALINQPNTQLFFLNDTDKSEVADSIIFVNNPLLHQPWEMWSNDSFICLAEVSTEDYIFTPFGLDSVKRIQLKVKSKYRSDSLMYSVNLSKTHGILEVFNFDAFRKFNHSLRFDNGLVLLPYKEYTKRAFMQISPGTETHNITKHVYDDFIYDTSEITKYYLNSQQELVYDIYRSVKRTTMWVGTVKLFRDTLYGIVYKNEHDTDGIFNPFPNTFNQLKHTINLVCGDSVYKVCHFGAQDYWERVGNDSLRLITGRVGDPFVSLQEEFVKGVGKTLSVEVGPLEWQFLIDLKYYKTSECEMGEKIELFAATKKPTFKPLKITPNPANSQFEIEGIDKSNYRCTITSSVGKLQEVYCHNNVLNIENLIPGIYILKVLIDDIIYQTRFIKM